MRVLKDKKTLGKGLLISTLENNSILLESLWGIISFQGFSLIISWRMFWNVFSSITQLCPALWDPMDCSTPGLPIHHQLSELAQTHVYRVDIIIQPSHPLSFPSPAFNLSQNQGLFQLSQFLTSGGQSIGVSASALVLLMNIQDWFPLGWTGWISLQSKGLSRVFSNITVQKHQLIIQCSVFFILQLSHPYLTTGKTIALTRSTFVGKVMSLLLNMLSRLLITFLPRSVF